MSKSNQNKIKIIFVCTGNTCRSPMAEFILKDYLKKRRLTNFSVSSAGLDTVKGSGMSPAARAALAYLDVAQSKHRSRQLTPAAVKNADLIVCMTMAHKEAILSKTGALDKVKTFGEITGGKDVADPYGADVETYIAVAKYLSYGCNDVVNAAVTLKPL